MQTSIRFNLVKITKLIAAFCIFLSLVGCTISGKGILIPGPSIPPCETAYLCAEIFSKSDSTVCDLKGAGDKPNGLGTQSWRMKNNHHDKTIYVTFNRSSKESGGPGASTEIDIIGLAPGEDKLLGCRVLKDKKEPYKAIYEWSYSVVTACFDRECPSAKLNPPPTKRDPKTTCESLCENGSSECEVIDLSKSTNAKPLENELKKLSSDIITSKPPTQISLSGITSLINQFAGAGQLICNRDEIILGNKNAKGISEFSNIGDKCPIAFGHLTPPVASLFITLPPVWEGELFSIAPSLAKPGAFLLKSSGLGKTPLISIINSQGKVETDPIRFITGTKDKMIFTGENLYCAQVSWSDSGDKN